MIVWYLPYQRNELTIYSLGLAFTVHRLGLSYKIIASQVDGDVFPFHSTFDSLIKPCLRQKTTLLKALHPGDHLITVTPLPPEILEHCHDHNISVCFAATNSVLSHNSSKNLFFQHSDRYDGVLCTDSNLGKYIIENTSCPSVVSLPYIPPCLPSLHNPKLNEPQVVGIYLDYGLDKPTLSFVMSLAEKVYSDLKYSVILYSPQPLKRQYEFSLNKFVLGREDKIDFIQSRSYDYSQYNLLYCDLMLYPSQSAKTEVSLASLIAGGIPTITLENPVFNDPVFCCNKLCVIVPSSKGQPDAALIKATKRLLQPETYNSFKKNLNPETLNKTWYTQALSAWNKALPLIFPSLMVW